jgi:hypothetical protein
LRSKQTCLHSIERVKKMKEMGVVYLFGMVPCQLGFAGAIELSKLRVSGRGSEGERARRNERTRAAGEIVACAKAYAVQAISPCYTSQP